MLKPLQCDNDRCRMRLEVKDVSIGKDGDKLYFDCPVCGTRTPVFTREVDGVIQYWTHMH
jgi:hypothetical protein